ncbi:MAG: hypothetical protein IKE69_00745 [Thermoguttaceae bacterium]|nr:hypothetical protein [Thermoguttaceae bacterium]
MEELYPDITDKIEKVFDDFTTKDDGSRIERRLKDVNPEYGDDENYYEPRDKSLVPEEYCTKIYSDGKTELFSTFLEEFMDNPLYIVSNYRERYERMIKCCR